jgi:transcription termination/antitermination protein NusG
MPEAAETRPEGTWYALKVKPRHDKAVNRMLEAIGYETFLPLYTVRRRYTTRWKQAELPLFPGYLFCRFHPRSKLPVLMIPGVTQIVGAGRTPMAVEEAEILSLRTAARAGVALEPLNFFHVGQKVRITDGPLAGVEGTVIRSQPSLQLVLSVTLLQRSVLLEIESRRVALESQLLDNRKLPLETGG